jgi:hypothetical protein
LLSLLLLLLLLRLGLLRGCLSAQQGEHVVLQRT